MTANVHDVTIFEGLNFFEIVSCKEHCIRTNALDSFGLSPLTFLLF